ncbi:PP-loop family protein [Cryptosporidium andersoni]|uniref:PP-loop family protein n=1 Tax=Cryptosporidium andersoni TaxID=117008 RepID=A0A1J4MY89_9CRYT|nr:PP-loop family protein [Cryptosporidium andersoni]
MKNFIIGEDQQSDFDKYCRKISENIIGNNYVINTPYGIRPLIYCDWTASGRCLSFIEESIIQNIAPYYGNTHSIASYNARQSTWYTIEARESVRQFVGGNPDDAIIFNGSGTTGAISKFLKLMDTSKWSSVISRSNKYHNLNKNICKDPNVNPNSDYFCHNTHISLISSQDRWRSYKCIICKTQYDTEAAFRRHCNKVHSVLNNQKNKSVIGYMSYLICFIADSTAHHSLLLPFRDYVTRYKNGIDCDTYKILFDYFEVGILNYKLDIENLRKYLDNMKKDYPKNFIPIILISAGSNLTGVINDYIMLSSLVHQYGGISVVDFAVLAPHIAPNMSPPLNINGFTDVGVFSPHKFLGGPSTPGVLVIKRDLLITEKPADPGGNCVFFVSSERHDYILDQEQREESGTLDLLGICRLGMMIKFEMHITHKLKRQREIQYYMKILRKFSKYNKNNTGSKIKILGIKDILGNKYNEIIQDEKYHVNIDEIKILPIISFLIKPFPPEIFHSANYELDLSENKKESALPNDLSNDTILLEFLAKNKKYSRYIKSLRHQYLHYNFVCALLNDIFGIQSRGGCSCAGPYSQKLLGLNKETVSTLYDELVIKGIESIRPGFSRISFHWSDCEESIDYISDAIIWIAENGWKLLPLYAFEEFYGMWRHKSEWKSLENLYREWLEDSIGDYFLEKPRIYNNKSNLELNKEVESDSFNQICTNLLNNKCRPLFSSSDQIFEQADKLISYIDRIIKNYNDYKEGLNPSNNKVDEVIFRDIQLYHYSLEHNDYRLNQFELQSESSLLWFLTPKIIQSLILCIQGRNVDFSIFNNEINQPVISTEYENLNTFSERANHNSSALNQEITLYKVENDRTNKSGSYEKSYCYQSEDLSCCIPNINPNDASYETEKYKFINKDLCDSCPNNLNNNEMTFDGTLSQIDHEIIQGIEDLGNNKETQKVYLNEDSVESNSYKYSSNMDICDLTIPDPSSYGIIRKQVGLAIKTFNMIKQGDRILVGVSGGKDSLTMLHTLLLLQRISPVKFSIAAATVDPQTKEMDVTSLKPYMNSLGIEYHFLSYPIVQLASKLKYKQKKLSYCSFCARMKRGILYSCMKKYDYNVLALGQHTDDICESFLLSIIHNGKLNTMKANYLVPKYNIRVIRPMIYCRERDLEKFALRWKLPVVTENCPACFPQAKERRRVKQLLSQEEIDHPNVHTSIIKALQPLISLDRTNSKFDVNSLNLKD